MLAYADGKEVEWKDRSNCRNNGEWVSNNLMHFNWENNDYRIKSEPKYRPFNSAEECWQEMQKHQPFGWLVHDDMNCKIHINFLCGTSLAFEGGSLKGFTTLLDEDYTFADGTPFGIMEEGV